MRIQPAFLDLIVLSWLSAALGMRRAALTGVLVQVFQISSFQVFISLSINATYNYIDYNTIMQK